MCGHSDNTPLLVIAGAMREVLDLDVPGLLRRHDSSR